MIVSDSQKFVFIHNPKCAGTSIRYCLKFYETMNSFFEGAKTIENEKVGLMHMPLWKLSSLFPNIFQSKLLGYYTFVTIRNPYTRTIAAFNSSSEKDFLNYKTSDNLEQYKSILNSFIENLNEKEIRNYEYNVRHFVPQIDMVYLNDDKIPETVLKVEDLPGAFNNILWMHPIIADRLINYTKKLNIRSINGSYETILTKKSIQRINEVYKRDFEEFKYNTI